MVACCVKAYQSQQRLALNFDDSNTNSCIRSAAIKTWARHQIPSPTLGGMSLLDVVFDPSDAIRTRT